MRNLIILLPLFLLNSIILSAETDDTKSIITNPPSTTFTANKTYSCDGIIQFTSTATNTPTSWKWAFGDGDTSVLQNPTHTYSNSGNYDVTLITCNSFGCDTLTQTQFVTVDFNGFCDTVIFPVSGIPFSTTLYSCNGILYDDGGPNGNYSSSFSDNVTINPPNALGINLTFNSFNLDNNISRIEIYDGVYSFSPLIATYNASNPPPATLYIDGPVRIYFQTSSNSTTASGFEIAWQCVANNCGAITGFTANNIQTNSVNLSWNNPGDAAAYILQWKEINNTEWITDTISNNQYLLTNLYSQNTYEWRLRSICSSYGMSVWSGVNTFTTSTAFSITPDSLTATLIKGDSTTQNFTINNLTNNALQYDVAIEMSNGNLYKENFEEGNYNSLTASYLGNSYYQYEIKNNLTNQATIGYQNLEITGGNQQNLDGLAHTLSNYQQPKYISFRIKSASTFVNGGHFSIGKNYTSGLDIEVIRFNCNASGMGIDNSASQQYRVPYSADEWYFIEFKNIDFATRTYDYYVNGQLAHPNISFKSTTNNINQIRLYNYDNTTTNFDNIMVNANDIISTDWLNISNVNEVSPNGTATPTVHFNTENTPVGSYSGTLDVRSLYPDSMSKMVHIDLNVIAAPATDFTSSHTTTCTGHISFTDNSLNSPTSWLWDFGDGTTSTTQNPTHIYINNGFYDVSLITCNTIGCDTILKENYLKVTINGTYCDTTLMPTNGSITVTNCTGTLYDDGGPNGNYSNSTSGTVVIQPTNAQSIILTTSYAQIQSFSDGLNVHDGNSVAAPTLPVYNSISGLSSPVVTSTGNAITVNFFSNNSQNYDGFEMSWQCIDNNCTTPSNLTETNLEVNEVTLNWENMFDIPNYNLRWREVNTLQWEETNVLDSTFILQDLGGGTTYEWQVQKICNGGAINTWSTLETFTTLMAFSVSPDSLNVTLLVGDTSLQNVNISNLISNTINITSTSLLVGGDILEENFEDDNYDNWTITTPGYASYYDVSSQNPSSGEFALDIEGGDFPNEHGVTHNFGEHTPEYISFDINIEKEQVYPYAYFRIGNSNAFTAGALRFFVSNSYMGITVNNSEVYGVNFNANEWYRVEFKNINYITKKFDCYINNILLASGINFADYANSIDEIRIINDSDSRVSFDNIIVKSIENTTNQWLTIDSNPSIINSTLSGIVTAKFDATNLTTGVYNSEIRIKSSPTDSMFVTIPCHLTVVDQPETNFGANSLTTCIGTIQFTDSTINEPTSWLWDFGDGNTSTAQNPSNTYQNDGLYDVSLITCNAQGCDTLTRNQYITVDFDMPFCDTIIMATNGDTIHSSACTGVIYDSGGPDVDINSGHNKGTVKINVPTASAIKFTFSKFNIASGYGNVQIYDGHWPSATLLATYDGSINTPPIISSSGVVTIRYYISNNNFSVLSGFEIHWECVNAVCGTPNNQQTSNITVSEATASWDSTSANNYLLEWREIGHPIWNETIIEDTTHVFTGLAGATDYEWKVTNYCEGDGLGNWNGINTFTTNTAFTLSADTLSFTLLAGDSISQQVFVNNLTNNTLNLQTFLTPIQGDIYHEGFEDGTLFSLDTDNDNHQEYEVSDENPASGLYNLKILQGIGGSLVGSGGIVHDFNSSTPAYISFDVNVGTSGNADGTFEVTNLYPSTSFNIISFNTTGSGMGVYTFLGGGTSYRVPYNIDQWYHIEFRNINFNTKTYDYYRDNILVAQDIPFTNSGSGTSSANRIEMRNEYLSSSHFDNININSVNVTPALWLTSSYNNNDSITLQINTNGYTEGTYTGNITTTSTLPDSMLTNINVQLTILEPIETGFIVDKTYTCNGQVQFTDTSAGTVTSWFWDFGDGSLSTLQNPNHIFSNSGLYDISLITCNGLMCDTTVRNQYIEVDYTALYCDTVWMFNNQNFTVTTCTGTLYDNGGETGLYANNSNDTISIQPTNAQSITITFDTINVHWYDSIKVYNGAAIFANLIASYTYTYTSPPPIVINNSTATIVFISNNNNRGAGFGLTWACTSFDCAAPTLLTTNTNISDATLSWNDISSLEYNVRWKSIQDSIWLETSTLDTFHVINNLIGGHYYEWQVQSLCSGGNIGTWSQIDTFLTNGAFDVSPDTLQVTLLQGDFTTRDLFLSNLLNNNLDYNIEWPSSSAVFWEDFESGNYNNFTTANSFTFTPTIIQNNIASGQYSLKLSGGNNVGNIALYNFSIATNPKYIAFKTKINTTTSEGGNVWIKSDPGGVKINFSFNQLGMGVTANGIDYRLPHNANQWYHIEFKNIDYVNNKFDYYVDGQLLIADIPFVVSNGNTLGGINIYNYDNVDSYFDDIIFSNNTFVEPNWLQTQSVNGTIGSLSNDTINVEFNATGLPFGTYEKQLRIHSSQPDSTVKSVLCILDVIVLPETNFEANKTYSCDGIIEFNSNGTTHNPISWQWDFGDGNTDTVQYPIQVYQTNGTFDVILITCNSNGCDTLTKPNYININLGGTYCDTLYTPTDFSTITNTACTGVIYDDGGANGNYSTNASGTIVIEPTGSDFVVLTIQSLQLESCCDFLTIYDGNSTSAPTIAVTGNNQQIISSTGAITVKFTSNSSITDAGFEITWECFDSTVCFVPTGLVVDNILTLSARLNWANSPNIMNYALRWRELGTTVWQTDSITTNSLPIQNLAYNSLYEWQVQGLCTNGNGSNWSVLDTFSTITGPPYVVQTVINDVTCFGGNDGSIDITINGGTLPYSYQWTTGDTTQNLSNMAAGNYSCTVTDLVGATVLTGILTVNEPTAITLADSTIINDDGTGNGSIDVIITGGTAPYQYNWSNGDTVANITNLMTSIYTLTVTDAAGCMETFMIDLPVSTNSILASKLDLNIHPNPVRNGGTVTLEISEISENVSYELHNLLGQQVDSGVIDVQNERSKVKMPNEQGFYLLTILVDSEKVKTFRILVE